MPSELAYVLVTPRCVEKGRVGAMLARLLSQTTLELVAARMLGPREAFVREYAGLVETTESDPATARILADYVRREFAPDPRTGLRRRVLCVLLEGENAVARVTEAVGSLSVAPQNGRTLRDSFGDCVTDGGRPIFVEPAVFASTTAEANRRALQILARHTESDGGLVADAVGVPSGAGVQTTFVMIKPDNFRFPGARPGYVIDLFARSGLALIGAKVHRMSVEEAETFYGPVREVLRTRLARVAGERAVRAIQQELALELPPAEVEELGRRLGPLYGDEQFAQIVQFITGRRPERCSPEERRLPGTERVLALAYRGPDAVETIRRILGPTDPAKALPGHVRKEFGRDIMVNTAHASDSVENAERELRIVRVEADSLREWIARYASGVG